MNIPADILDRAEELGLKAVATGGGCDFITVQADGGTIVLSSQATSECPEAIDEPSTITCFIDEEWTEVAYELTFFTAEEAMQEMAACLPS